MRKDILSWSRTCVPCQRAKIQRHTKNLPTKIDIPDERFEHVHMDIVILPADEGYRYCLTMMDRFSRWPEAVPLKTITAEAVAKAFYDNWVTRFGAPKVITTDQGTQFESALFASLSKLLGTQRIRTTPYHPASNGMLERWHRALKVALMCQQSHSWTTVLPTVLFGLRTCIKEDLKVSAAELLFGTTLRLPGEFFVNEHQVNNNVLDPITVVDRIRQSIRAIRTLQTAHHIKPAVFKHKALNESTHVFLRVDSVQKPLEEPYTGPHEVIKRFDNNTYLIKVKGAETTVSTERLKPAFIEKCDSSTIPATTRSQQEPLPSILVSPHTTSETSDEYFLRSFQPETTSEHINNKKVTFAEQDDVHYFEKNMSPSLRQDNTEMAIPSQQHQRCYWKGGDVVDTCFIPHVTQPNSHFRKRKQKLTTLGWS